MSLEKTCHRETVKVASHTSAITSEVHYGFVYIDEPIFGRADTNDDGDFGDSEEQFYYTTNNLYNVVALLDTSGNIIERYEYKPYGEVTIYIDDGGDGDWTDGDETEGSLSGNYYLFTGRRLDPEAGLYYFRARMYSPELGRFLQRDSIGYRSGANLYLAYFIPNGVDPHGREPVTTGSAVVIIVLKKFFYDVGLPTLVGALTDPESFGKGAVSGLVGGAVGLIPGPKGSIGGSVAAYVTSTLLHGQFDTKCPRWRMGFFVSLALGVVGALDNTGEFVDPITTSISVAVANVYYSTIMESEAAGERMVGKRRRAVEEVIEELNK